MWYFVGLPEHYDRLRPGPPERQESLAFLNIFRSILTAGVILHHTGIAYGGPGRWYYKEAAGASPRSLTTQCLWLLAAFNQSWILGAFFMLSGFLSAKSMDTRRRDGRWDPQKGTQQVDDHRCGAWRFFRRRMYRLGVPTLIFTLLVHPVAIAIGSGTLFSLTFLRAYWSQLLSAPGPRGPTWHFALNLLLDGAHALYLSYAPFQGLPVPRFAPPALLSLTMLSSFLIRKSWPVGRIFIPLNLQFAYLPQYIMAYLTGCFVYRHPHIIHRSQAAPIRASLPSLLLFAATTVPLIWLAGSEHVDQDPTDSAVYAIWNELGFCIITHAIWDVLRVHCNTRDYALNKWTYAATLVHPVICTAIGVWAKAWDVNPLIKTAIIGPISVVASFLGGWTLESSLFRLVSI